MKHKNSENDVLVLKKGEGREYKLGTMSAVFKADIDETAEKYSISEWWLEPGHHGEPSPHLHEDKQSVIYVLEGIVSFLVGETWIDAVEGTLIRIPCNTIHTFANNTDKKAGFLNFDIPGGFENELPGMVKWFEDNR